ncbi:PREDICTED: ATP-dependent DNA helicase PIF1-like [Camelina sativa]|uniref:ATP-dependent DNA helicase PIF1-like n=1 Tax=Camelina sativa TaxID=90675 RepID=A0ABM0Y465_CAMSA|nr:PREDICTED: ATP-dependent DNA helicase PIF1-like [Camelina sativa]
MRLMKNGLTESEANDIKDFSEWILAVGDGRLGEPNDGEALIDIPKELLIRNVDDPIEAISRAVYENLELLHGKNYPEFFRQRAILCPTNNDVNTINERLLAKLEGEKVIYLSADSIDPQDVESLSNPIFSSDFLNSIKLSGLPNHCLRLKIGAPVILLRNIDPKGGLCNDPKLPFRMRRRQFPLAVAFAMTINKSQGQSLNEVGLFLPRPVFSHGQLYVALSRVTSKKGLKVLIVDKEGEIQSQTMNVVFKEIFQNLKN